MSALVRIRVNRAWWQFWLPDYIWGEIVDVSGTTGLVDGIYESKPKNPHSLYDPYDLSGSQAVEVEDKAFYDPDSDSNVVVTEPKGIAVAKAREKNEMRRMQNPG